MTVNRGQRESNERCARRIRDKIIEMTGMRGKITNYFRTDRSKGVRTDIRPEDTLDQLAAQRGLCPICCEPVALDQMSMDRTDNGGHRKHRFQVTHRGCNVAKR